MDRNSKLVDLTLVTKYYPVANYSYPRKNSRSAAHGKEDRESLGSDSSAPGLVDDRTDSEASLDDDYQYRTSTDELWDSFWPPRAESKKPQETLAPPAKLYPALIPSPRRKKQQQLPSSRAPSPPMAWPLPNGTPPSQRRTRKPAGAFIESPTPKPTGNPKDPSPAIPPRSPRRHSKARPPRRPARPAETLLTPCIQQPGFVSGALVTSDFVILKDRDLQALSPVPPRTSYEQRPSKSMDEKTSPGPKYTIFPVSSRSSTHLPLPETRPSPQRSPRHFKSMAALPSRAPEPEPHSVFELDSDDDDEPRPFFTFHKRSQSSDQKRKHQRSKSNTAVTPTTPIDMQFSDLDSPKRHGHDVFGRLLGRRSR